MLNTGLIINNRYRIVKLLGQGGFGAVYRAWDINLNRPCALKMNLDTSQEAQRQFQREASTLSGLLHPNLPRVTDHFYVAGQGQFLVMDYADGEDLETRMAREGQFAPEQALPIITQVADALAYLHKQEPPIIHRDIKPANIRINAEGHVFLVDFGLAKVFDQHLRTTIGARAVTPGFSPPEQYGQGNTDARTDVYALAATLYTLLTGAEPQESVQRIVEDKLQPLDQINTAVSEPISTALSQAMSLNPSQRYQTIDEFVQSLTQPTSAPTISVPVVDPVVMAGNGNVPVAAPVAPPPPEGTKVSPVWWVLGTAVLLSSIFFLVILPNTRRQAAQELAWQVTRQAEGTAVMQTTLAGTAQAAITATAVSAQATSAVEARNKIVAASETQATRSFGPRNGVLTHIDNSSIQADYADLNLKNFIVEATFINPYGPMNGSWDYGFVFRYIDNEFYTLYVKSNGQWNLDSVLDGDWMVVSSGSLPGLLLLGNDQTNKIRLMCINDRGWLYINDEFISELDLSSHTTSGDVAVATGILKGDEVEGEETRYLGFTIWSLP